MRICVSYPDSADIKFYSEVLGKKNGIYSQKFDPGIIKNVAEGK